MFLALTLMLNISASPRTVAPALLASAAAVGAAATPTAARAPEPALASIDPEPSTTSASAESADAEPQPVPAVTYMPGRLTPEPVGAAAPASAAPAFQPVAQQTAHAGEERTRRLWLNLSLAQHSAAVFDAWSTRRVISSGAGQELNPMLRPFASNASLYAAIQVGPAILDYVSYRMMHSEHGWARRTWWVPQALGTAVSFASGIHNLSVYNAAH